MYTESKQKGETAETRSFVLLTSRLTYTGFSSVFFFFFFKGALCSFQKRKMSSVFSDQNKLKALFVFIAE